MKDECVYCRWHDMETDTCSYDEEALCLMNDPNYFEEREWDLSMDEIDVFQSVPLNTPVNMIDDYHNSYIGTVVKRENGYVKGECFSGNEEMFYRNKMVAWGKLTETQRFLMRQLLKHL